MAKLTKGFTRDSPEVRRVIEVMPEALVKALQKGIAEDDATDKRLGINEYDPVRLARLAREKKT